MELQRRSPPLITRRWLGPNVYANLREPTLVIDGEVFFFLSEEEAHLGGHEVSRSPAAAPLRHG